MGNIIKISNKIVQPGFHNITDQIEEALKKLLKENQNNSGILLIFCMHTSCGLTINESFDPTARQDLEAFYDHIAPSNLSFIKHDYEGDDDSPAHMKTSLVGNSLSLIVEEGRLVLGQWQGIYLAEFRKGVRVRNVVVKYQPD